jgi:hypothetical protein
MRCSFRRNLDRDGRSSTSAAECCDVSAEESIVLVSHGDSESTYAVDDSVAVDVLVSAKT